MTRPRHSRSNLALVVALSVAALVLGVACTFWALTNITSEAVNDAYSAPLASQAVPVAPAPDATSSVGVVASSTVEASQPALYTRHPKEGDKVGTLSIPALKQTLPIIEGTGDDDLKKGVGHFTKSVLPGETDNCVLSGHRDTVFSRLGKLKKGDRFVTETAAGTFTYVIKRIRIVHKNDRTVIVPTDHAVLTVSTCYPFNFIGAAPDRYVLVADLVTGQ